MASRERRYSSTRRCVCWWRYLAAIYISIYVIGPNRATVGAIKCIFLNNGTTTTVSPNLPGHIKQLDCQDTCCCNKPQCCACDTSNTSGLTFIPCDVKNATPLANLPSLDVGWATTDFDLYEECYDTTTTSSSTATTTTATTTATTPITTVSETTNPSSSQTSSSSSTGSPQPPQEKKGGDSGGLSSGPIIGLVIGVIVAIVLIALIIIFIIKRHNRKNTKVDDEETKSSELEDTPVPTPTSAGPRSTHLQPLPNIFAMNKVHPTTPRDIEYDHRLIAE